MEAKGFAKKDLNFIFIRQAKIAKQTYMKRANDCYQYYKKVTKMGPYLGRNQYLSADLPDAAHLIKPTSRGMFYTQLDRPLGSRKEFE
jgi:hypothetical protein